MEAQNEKAFESEFEIKIDIGMNGRELKSVLQKLSISIWNRLCRENQSPTLQLQHPQDGFSRPNYQSDQMNQHRLMMRKVTQRLFVLIGIKIFRVDINPTQN